MPFAAGHHSETFRVYYEDTDAGGIVYHANYLKYAERARADGYVGGVTACARRRTFLY